MTFHLLVERSVSLISPMEVVADGTVRTKVKT